MSEPRTTHVTHTTVTGWGRHRSAHVTRITPADRDALEAVALPASGVLARGLGRSYGDAAHHDEGTVVDTTACTNSRWLDAVTGLLRVDAGTSIGALVDRYAPRGWFVPVTPGTRQVTLGGAIAADIHGKNHHVDGSFGDHVERLTLRLADDSIVSVSPTDDAALFWATVGGMGLTGIVLDADIRMQPIASTRVRVETERFTHLDDLMDRMVASDAHHTFSVAWVDLLNNSRSVLTQGGFATPDDVADDPAGRFRRPPNPNVALPAMPPVRFVHRSLMRGFNEAWFRRAPSEPTTTLESVTSFFHPLDAIRNWNVLYGRQGFVQWQCALPDAATDELRAICRDLGDLPSFLTVLKRFGPGNDAPMSFPIEGWTLAVDLPATAAVLQLLHAFDRRVADHGGRIYLAKDARMRADMVAAMYPRLDEWRAVRERVDPARRFDSDLSHRLAL